MNRLSRVNKVFITMAFLGFLSAGLHNICEASLHSSDDVDVCQVCQNAVSSTHASVTHEAPEFKEEKRVVLTVLGRFDLSSYTSQSLRGPPPFHI